MDRLHRMNPNYTRQFPTTTNTSTGIRYTNDNVGLVFTKQSYKDIRSHFRLFFAHKVTPEKDFHHKTDAAFLAQWIWWNATKRQQPTLAAIHDFLYQIGVRNSDIDLTSNYFLNPAHYRELIGLIEKTIFAQIGEVPLRRDWKPSRTQSSWYDQLNFHDRSTVNNERIFLQDRPRKRHHSSNDYGYYGPCERDSQRHEIVASNILPQNVPNHPSFNCNVCVCFLR